VTIHIAWDPTEWERWANLLVTARYGHKYQRVSANDRGDFGIEGYTDCGCLFQCYAPNEPCASTTDRYEKHNGKIYRDTLKLKKYNDDISRLLCGKKVSYWLLVVPYIDSKETVVYAAKRTKTVRGWGLSCIDSDFAIRVLDQQAFTAEREQLSEPFDKSSHLRRSSDADGQVIPAADLVDTMAGKIAELVPDAERCARVVNELREKWMQGQNILEGLRVRWPRDYEDFLRLKDDRQSTLELDRLLAGPNAGLQRWLDLQRSLTADYAKIIGIDEDVARNLARESIADWLMRCPLEFP